MTAHPEKPDDGKVVRTATGEPTVSLSRRRLIGGAAVTLPTILTLRSGTLAAASFSGAVTPSRYAPLDEQGRVLCIDPLSTQGYAGKSGNLKLGDPPSAQVYAIPSYDRKYYDQYDAATGAASGEVTPTEICYQEGTLAPYYYQLPDGTWVERSLPPGAMISAMALTSAMYSDNFINITEI